MNIFFAQNRSRNGQIFNGQHFRPFRDLSNQQYLTLPHTEPFAFRRSAPVPTLRATMPLAQNLLLELRRLLGAVNVLSEKEDLIPYSFDGTAAMSRMPGCVAFANTTEQVAAVLKFANENKLQVVTRGSGTGLSG